MSEISRDMIEAIVRKVITEKFMPTKKVDPSGITSISLPEIEVAEEDRLDTGNPTDIVYCKDLFSLKESPRIGCGLMVMKDTDFDWTLNYDEVDYIISGRLDICIDGRTVSAGPGEIILIPKGSSITFSVKGEVRFIYVVYPADWANQ